MRFKSCFRFIPKCQMFIIVNSIFQPSLRGSVTLDKNICNRTYQFRQFMISRDHFKCPYFFLFSAITANF